MLMKNILYSCFLLISLSSSLTGCAGVSAGKAAAVSAQMNKAVAVSASAEEALAEVPLGTVFAKTEFSGVVQTSYIELSIVDQADETKTYTLVIGDKSRQMSFPWKVQTVQPGYFFIELPVGTYHIHSISIPVGSTTADEPMDVVFHVKEGKVVYLGTLKVMGTKERIKLGGVPVLKPGFEYLAEVIDERAEALLQLRERFPQLTGEIEFGLMTINPPAEASPL